MKRKKTKSIVEYLAMMLFIKFFKFLPYKFSESVLITLFVFFGNTFRIRKKIALQQIQDSLPDVNDKNRIIHDTYKHLAKVAADMYINNSDTDKQITIDGWNNIKHSLSLGRGLLIVSGHLGNWEFAGRFLAAQNITINVVIKRLRNQYVNNYTNKIRNKHGIKIIYKNKSLKPTLQAFKNNEAVVALIDQDAGKEGTCLPFLGRNASLFTGFVRLSQKLDTPIVFGAVLRNNDGSYRFVFDKPIIPSEYCREHSLTDKTTAEIVIAKHFHNRLEQFIVHYPGQWFWLHNRWKGAHKAKIAL